MAKDNQNVKETKATLNDHLNNVGLKDDTAFKKARTAYNSLWSKQRVKADLDKWHDIGRFFFDAKQAMADKKISMNSGHLTKIRTAYFKEMTAQDFSNAVWLHEHFPEVKLWIEANKRNLSNPASIKQAIRKSFMDKRDSLKTPEDKTKWENDFLKFFPKSQLPKDNSGNSGSGSSDNSGNNPVDTKVSHDERLKHLELITNQLIKTGPKDWTLERFKQFETTLQTLENFYEDMSDKLEKAGTVKVNSEVMKKKAA